MVVVVGVKESLILSLETVFQLNMTFLIITIILMKGHHIIVVLLSRSRFMDNILHNTPEGEVVEEAVSTTEVEAVAGAEEALGEEEEEEEEVRQTTELQIIGVEETEHTLMLEWKEAETGEEEENIRFRKRRKNGCNATFESTSKI